ncbi:hypothetical protein KKA47_00485 [bacterium]|nr:hypothetical protein [bacterium]
MNKKLILGIVVLIIIVLASFIFLDIGKQKEETVLIPPPVPELAPLPVPLPLTTKEYVYDDKLRFGFEYPEGWEFSINVDSPDKNIKKTMVFKKDFKKKFEGSEYESEVSVQIQLIVKSVTDLEVVKTEFMKGLEMSGLPILNEAIISVNNISGYDILSGIPAWKLRQVVFFANGMAYIFEYQSQDEFYRMYEETFNNTINSFNINPYPQTSQSSKEIMRSADGTWILSDGYTLTANAIDSNAKTVWLTLSKNGIPLGDRILNEGEIYTINNSIKIKIAKISVVANSDVVTLTDESVATPFP